MDNQGKSNKQIKDSGIIAGIAIAILFWIIGYLILFGQKKQFKELYNTNPTSYTYIQYDK